MDQIFESKIATGFENDEDDAYSVLRFLEVTTCRRPRDSAKNVAAVHLRLLPLLRGALLRGLALALLLLRRSRHAVPSGARQPPAEAPHPGRLS